MVPIKKTITIPDLNVTIPFKVIYFQIITCDHRFKTKQSASDVEHHDVIPQGKTGRLI